MRNALKTKDATALLFALAMAPWASQAREGFVQLSAGGYHTCGVTTAHTVKCWGTNSSGQVGDGTVLDRRVPVSVAGLPTTATAVSAGGESTCALIDDGSVWCWGSNRLAQSGSGPMALGVPRMVPGVRDAVAIHNGGAQACVITRDARVLCWGFHYTEAQCSHDWFQGTTCKYTPHLQSTPIEVAGLRGARELRTSPSRGYGSPDMGPSVCAVDGLGTVRCADRFDRDVQVMSDMGQGIRSLAIFLGNPCGVTAAGSLTCETWRAGGSYIPARYIPGMDKDVAAIGTMGDTACAVTAQGRALCSGSTLGDGTRLKREVPIEAAGLRDVGSIAAGWDHACALLTNGEAYCWGRNTGGATGSGSAMDPVVVPIGVKGFSERVLADAPGPLTGIWWNPSEPGWGLQIADRRDTSVVALFTYDAAGRAKWYFASNCVLGTNVLETQARCSSALHEMHGPAFPLGAFDAQPVGMREAGTLRLEFTGRNAATATITLDGVTRTKAVERYSFRAGANPLPNDFSDLWWNPQEAGWGLAVTHQADKMFLTWYAYDAGEPVWYYVADCTIANTGCAGVLYRSTGPAPAPGFDPAQVRPVAVGTASLSFADPNSATLSYSINGLNGMRALTRYRF